MIKFLYFLEHSGQLVCSVEDYTFAVDVPVQDGRFISGEALKSYVQGFVPTELLERKQKLASAEGASEVHLLCEGTAPDTTPSYAELRAVAYPPVTEYLDAIVKGDQEQLDAYIQNCQAVKALYPKPPELEDFQKRRLQEAL